MPAFSLLRRFSTLAWVALFALLIFGFRAAPVQAFNRNQEGAGVDLYLKPHFYHSLWFYTFSGLLLALVVGGNRRSIRTRGKVLQKEIGDRKRPEDELRHREAELQDALRAAQMGVWNWTLETDAVTWDETLYHLTGRNPNLPAPDSKEEVELFTPESLKRLNVAVEETKATGTPYEVDVEIVLPDGSKKWLIARGEPRRDAQGRVISLRGTLQDITERKRAQEVKALLASIVECSEDAIIGNCLDGTILSWNKGAEILYGYSAQEMIGKPVSMLALADRSDQMPSILERVRRGEKVSHFETMRHRKDGTVVDVSVAVSPIVGVNGEVTGAATIMRDISERKRTELEMHKAKEAAEAASRAKSEFLANMSHEIRTPMNGIIGMTDLALDTPLTSEQRDYLTMVKDSADSLLTLINDILDSSKIDAGKLSLDNAEFNLFDVLGNNLRLLSVRAAEKGLELAWSAKAAVPERVVGDVGRFRQVITNLVGNAIKFTEEGEVEVGVEVESRQEETILLHFTVRDTGIGVAPEKQKFIFDAFAQADSSMTRKYGGTGLGLTISSRLVQMMDGRIWLESEPGQGSTFHLTVRFGLPKYPIKQAPEPVPVSLRDLPVLVIDDNSTNRKILDAMLKQWLMAPELASGASEGLATLERAASTGTPFPLVLLDAQMPEMDGFSLAERIRQNPRLAGATVMMLTSAGHQGDVARCRELGVAVYLVKPIRKSELLEAILAALEKSPAAAGRPAVITRHTLREGRRKLQILLVEDNAVNQQLALRLLEKRGHFVTIASDGREALALLKQSRFDLALIDVQMPVMDGFEATAAIRKEEASTGNHLPIIAMTAHAMQGDRERCLAAGMDSYISKPVQGDELIEIVERVGNIMPPERTSANSSAKVFDREGALARLQGDEELLADLARVLLQDLPGHLIEIQKSIDEENLPALERAAHSLKGAVANFSAKRPFNIAFEMENKARSGDLAQSRSLLALLREEMDALKSELSQLLTAKA